MYMMAVIRVNDVEVEFLAKSDFKTPHELIAHLMTINEDWVRKNAYVAREDLGFPREEK